MPGRGNGGSARSMTPSSRGGKVAAGGAVAASGAAAYQVTKETGSKVSESQPNDPAVSTSILDSIISSATSNPEYVVLVLAVLVVVVAWAVNE